MPDTHPLIAPQIYTSKGFINTGLGSLSVLHLGCGSRKIVGAMGVDVLAMPGVDMVHDLEKTPWPLPSDTYDVIVLHAVLEHLQPFVQVMEEIHRVGKKGARVIINVPYFRCVDAYSDPTHVRFFTSRTLDYVLESGGVADYGYTKGRFRKLGFWYGWPQPSRNPLMRLLKFTAHKWPRWYDQNLSILFPFKILVWELSVVK
jgi:SAM-dependent methyltransferase